MTRVLLALALIVCVVAKAPAHEFTCEHVRSFKPVIASMSADELKAWIKRLGLSRKQVRQGRACLRGS